MFLTFDLLSERVIFCIALQAGNQPAMLFQGSMADLGIILVCESGAQSKRLSAKTLELI